MKTKKLKTACLLTFGLMTSTVAVASVVSCGSKTESEAPAPAPNPNPSHPDSESNPNPEHTLSSVSVSLSPSGKVNEGEEIRATARINDSSISGVTYNWEIVGGTTTISSHDKSVTFTANKNDNGKTLKVTAIKGSQKVSATQVLNILAKPTTPPEPSKDWLKPGMEGEDNAIHYRVNDDKKSLTITSVDYNSFKPGSAVVEVANLTIKQKYTITNPDKKDETVELPVTIIAPNAAATIPGIDKIKVAHFSLPEGLLEIGSNAFSGNVCLTGQLDIPSTVTKIGNNAFFGCTGLTGKLTLPAGLTQLGASAFSGCATITDLDLTRATKITEIPNGCFTGCLALGSVGSRNLIIPNNITTIGGKAFWQCKGFQTITFSGNSRLTDIGNNAFAGCSNLEGDLIIPDSVTRIGNSAFQGSYKLPWSSRGDPTTDKAIRVYFNSLDLDQRPTTIEGFKEAVAKFLNESRKDLPAGSNQTPKNGSKYLASDVQVKESDFKYDSSKDHVKVDAIIVQTAGDDIRYYTGPTALDYDVAPILTPSVSNISLYNAKKPSRVTLGSNLQTIELDAFKNCNNIVNITFRTNKLTTIGAQAFQDCENWAGEVDIPNSVTTIDKEAFDGCDKLTKITVSKNLNLGVGKPEWLPNKKKWDKDDSLSTSSTVVFVPKNKN